jgi:hypothetical protein
MSSRLFTLTNYTKYSQMPRKDTGIDQKYNAYPDSKQTVDVQRVLLVSYYSLLIILRRN